MHYLKEISLDRCNNAKINNNSGTKKQFMLIFFTYKANRLLSERFRVIFIRNNMEWSFEKDQSNFDKSGSNFTGI